MLPAKQRLQLHATQAASASRQIALLRAFGAVGVPVERLPARVSEAQLAAALAPFGRFATARPPSFVAPRTVQALWAAAADGDVSSLAAADLSGGAGGGGGHGGGARRARRRRGVSNLASLT